MRYLFLLLPLFPAFAEALPLQWIAPANERIWTLRLDGQAPAYLLLNPDGEGGGTFTGSGWSGTLSGNEVHLQRSGRKLDFDRGALVGGESATGVTDGTIEGLWDARPNQSGGIVGDIWSGADRLKLFYTNPNQAGAFVLSFCLLGLGLAIVSRRIVLRLAGVALLIAGFYLLIQTGSRGALVGFGAGAVCAVLAGRVRLFNWRILLVVLTLSAGLFGLVSYSKFGDRFTRKLFERSQANAPRIVLAQAGLRMMYDNPAGWAGLCADAESVGYAYCEWYKPLDVYKGWKKLLNSHLQFLVYHGWVLKALYVFVWLMGLAVLVLRRQAAAAGMWLGLAVTACFNDTLSERTLWIAPAAVTLAGFVRGAWPSRRALALTAGGSACGTAAVLCALLWIGSRQSAPEGAKFAATGNRVILNARNSEAVGSWVVDDDVVLSGGFPGFAGGELRRVCEGRYDLPAIGYVRELDAVPGFAVRIVVAGRKCRELLDRFAAGRLPRGFEGGRKQVVLLSPPFGWKAVPETFVARFHPVLVAGEFAARLTDEGGERPPWVRIVPGAELYIPNWIGLCLL